LSQFHLVCLPIFVHLDKELLCAVDKNRVDFALKLFNFDDKIIT
jgi:hypothetical protein